MRFRRGWLLLLCGGPLSASYSNLISTGDGSAVFFEVQTSFRGTEWYQARLEAGRPAVREAGQNLADIGVDAATAATSSFGERYCGFAGSTCWTAPSCQATLVVDGPAGRVTRYGRKTLVRLNRDGRKAWIEQTTECRGVGSPPPSAELQGLYEVPGLRRIAASGGLTLASQRAGRRLIANRDQVLARAANTQLHLVDQNGARPIRHQYGASEAVIDAEGRNIVYTDGSPGRMLWIDLAGQTEEEIGVGAAPALSDDGRLLAFLSPEGSLLLYRRQTRQLARAGDNVLEFALAGDGRYLFAVTGENRLLRIEVATGKAETWLEPFPEIRDTSSGFETDPAACPMICYYPPEPLVPLGRGSLVVLGGRHWPAGWRVRVADIERPLQLLSGEAAWFQVPAAAPEQRQRLEVFHPDHPLRFASMALARDRFPSCFGALHQEFDRIVSTEDPALAGEIVHVFLTGLPGVERVAEGVPNPINRLIPVIAPPALGGDGALEPLFFGLAPGLIGLQQLDVRILWPTPPGQPLFRDAPAAPNCQIPPT
jgi:uncharacterized protein (TIGR03437 family)